LAYSSAVDSRVLRLVPSDWDLPADRSFPGFAGFQLVLPVALFFFWESFSPGSRRREAQGPVGARMAFAKANRTGSSADAEPRTSRRWKFWLRPPGDARLPRIGLGQPELLGRAIHPILRRARDHWKAGPKLRTSTPEGALDRTTI
jgi:hypothetical protein